MKMRTQSIVVKVVLIILLLGCLFPLPYLYFQFVRAIGMVGFALLAYIDGQKPNKSLMIVWICSALIINPIFKVSLGRTLWNVLDVIWAIGLIITIIYEYKDYSKDRNSISN